jgi:hypothetical protein
MVLGVALRVDEGGVERQQPERDEVQAHLVQLGPARHAKTEDDEAPVCQHRERVRDWKGRAGAEAHVDDTHDGQGAQRHRDRSQRRVGELAQVGPRWADGPLQDEAEVEREGQCNCEDDTDDDAHVDRVIAVMPEAECIDTELQRRAAEQHAEAVHKAPLGL